MGEALFVYGTLRDDEVVRSVVGRVLEKSEGTIQGYLRHEGPAGFPYSYLSREEGGSAPGMVLMGLNPEDLARLDAYEGACYARRRGTVETATGRVEAWVYVGLKDVIERTRR